MKGKAYEIAIKKIGLSQRKAGPFLGFGERQSRRIVAGEAEVPGGAEKLLKLMVKRGITAEDLVAEIG